MKVFRSGTKIASTLAVGFVIIAAACGGGTSATTPATATPTPTIAAENRPPTTDFTFEPAAVPRGDNNQTIVTLTATVSDPDGDSPTFEWEIFRGTPATAEGRVVTTTFPGVAPYPVTLTVSDGRGGTVTVEKTVPLG